MDLRQRKFADEYLKTGNIYQSAIKAGYSEAYARSTACKLLDNVSIKEYIDKQLKKIDEKNIASAEDVLNYLTRVMNGEEDDYNSNGLKVKASLNEKTKAARLLGKRYAIFEDKVKVENHVSYHNPFAELEVDDIMEALGEGKKDDN